MKINPFLFSILLLIPLISFSQSIELDKELGAQNAKMVELQMGIYDDPAKTEYIRRFGQRLISQLERPLFEFQFHLVPDMTPNAFALLLASYSKGYETEADLEGIKIASSAGYDPNAMISSLTRMSEAIEVAVGYKEEKSYFNDHPYTPDRTKTIEKNSSKLEWETKDPISKVFLFESDSVLFGQSPGQGVVRENQFLHPDLNFSVEFPEKLLSIIKINHIF